MLGTNEYDMFDCEKCNVSNYEKNILVLHRTQPNQKLLQSVQKINLAKVIKRITIKMLALRIPGITISF